MRFLGTGLAAEEWIEIPDLSRRRQPALSWLALGSAITVAGSMTAAAGMSAYIHVSGSFSSTYGPLAGIFALLTLGLRDGADHRLQAFPTDAAGTAVFGGLGERE